MADFRAYCPKCKSKNINLYKDKKFRWGGPSDNGMLVLHCYVCGHELCSEKAQEEVDKQQLAWEIEEAKPKLPDPVAIAKKAAEDEKWRLIRIYRAKEAETKRIEAEKAEQTRVADAKKWAESRKVAWDAEVRASDLAWHKANTGGSKPAPKVIQPVSLAPKVVQPGAPVRGPEQIRRDVETISLIANGLGKAISSIGMCSRDVRAASKTFSATGQDFILAENAVHADVKAVGDIFLTISTAKTPDEARNRRTELLALVAGLPAKVALAVQAAKTERESALLALRQMQSSSSVTSCAYVECSNPPVANSKYCSSKCKDKNGRMAMKARALAAAIATNPPQAIPVVEPVIKVEPVIETPVVIETPAPVIEAPVGPVLCVFAGCGKVAGLNSKYCSRSCTDKAYKLRKKNLLATKEPVPAVEEVAAVPGVEVAAVLPVEEVAKPIDTERMTRSEQMERLVATGGMTTYSIGSESAVRFADGSVTTLASDTDSQPVAEVVGVEESQPRNKTPRKSPAKRVAPPPGTWAKHDQMDAVDLEKLIFTEIRKYAAYGLGIKGACKLPGSKHDLVMACMKVRQQRAST